MQKLMNIKYRIGHMQQYAKSVLDGSLNDQIQSYFEQVQPKTTKSIRELLGKKEVNINGKYRINKNSQVRVFIYYFSFLI